MARLSSPRLRAGNLAPVGFVPRLFAAACSSTADGVRGSRSLLTPKQRARAVSRRDAAQRNAAEYLQQKQSAPDATEAIRHAQQERRERLARESEHGYDGLTGGGGVTNIALEAQFAQMEREGAFQNLRGKGQPLPERRTTHFNDDALDALLNGVLAENNVKPESLELRGSYHEALTSFRRALAEAVRASDSCAEGSAALRRGGFEQQLEQLHATRRRFDDASVRDSLSFELPIRKLPQCGPTLDEEICRARDS